MGVTDSSYYKKVVRTLEQRASKLVEGSGTRQLNELVGSVEFKLTVEIGGMLEAIRALELAGYQLGRIGSRRHRRPNKIAYEELIAYHCTAALHEVGTFRNRLNRIFNLLAKDALRTRGPQRELMVKTARTDSMDALDSLQKLRDRHVHELPVIPTALTRVTLYGGRDTRRLRQMYKELARFYSRNWFWFANSLESFARFNIDWIGLILDPPKGEMRRRDAMEEFLSMLPIVEKPPRFRGRWLGPKKPAAAPKV